MKRAAQIALIVFALSLYAVRELIASFILGSIGIIALLILLGIAYALGSGLEAGFDYVVRNEEEEDGR